MIPVSRPIVAALWIVLALVGGRAAAQEVDHGAPVSYVARGPVFFAVLPSTGKRVDARNAAVLQRRIPLDLHDAPVPVAIDAIADRSGLEINYSRSLITDNARVTLAATEISVAAALTSVLLDAGLDVQITGPSRATLVKRTELPAATGATQATASITGHVTDAALKSPLSEVSVRVEGTPLRTIANADGRYSITGVAPGTYRVAARRVGYQPLLKDVTVAADQATTLDFALVAAPTRLDEVVTTAVGEQRRYEVGNDISTINADSIAPTAPITSLTDLISARAPGVTVLETSGMTGSGEAIRIEGLTSLVLQNDPILIVDGIRQNNAAGGDVDSYFLSGESHPSPTRLNDIDFSDIQTIDILKGPAASTEYGTDAANGVIVITTKHGSAGAPQWKVSAEQTESDMPDRFPNGYYSWGHLTDGTNSAVNCLLVPIYGGMAASAGPPYNTGATFGTCVVDSVTHENPLNNAATTIFGTGVRGKYDLSVGGGSDAVRYYVAGGVTNETGIVRLPAVFRTLADTADLGLPGAALSPNGEQQRSVRVNTAITLGRTADLAIAGSYLSTFQQSPNASYLSDAVLAAPALSGPANDYGYSFPGFSSEFTPISLLTELGSDNTNRVTGGLTANWRPRSWFTGHASLGLDHGSDQDKELNYPLANPAYLLYPPSLGLATTSTDIYSVDVRATATAAVSHDLRLATSAGVQLVDSRTAGQTALVSNITATNLTLNGATNPSVTQLADRQATLGGYGEEQVSVRDRLFLTGALRIDAASGFGSAYNVAAYPKASASWLLVNGNATTVRVRGAFGESGVQPMNGAALQLYSDQIIYANGGPVTGETLEWPGNPNLAPERTTEFEGGVDVSGWTNRVSIALTGYAKRTHDALVDENLEASLNNYTYQENIGDVRNMGAEASVMATLIDGRSVTWTVGVNAAVNHNTLLTLAPGVTAQTLYGSYVTFRQAAGYPLYGIWNYPASYRDANHDGIIEPSELTVGDSLEYVGPGTPTREASVTSHLSLWHGAIALGALFDYRGGYYIADDIAFDADRAGNTPGTNDPSAPLWLQAREIANCCSGSALDEEDGSFIRFRELSATYTVPRTILRALRVHSASVTGAVRNLALWTRYTGVDPEVSNVVGDNIQPQQTSNANVVNNDVRENRGAVPLARYWVIRLNVGL